MREFKSVKKSFEDCPFKMMLPKTTVEEPFLNIDIFINFVGKPRAIKYIVSGCCVIDKLGNKITAIPDDPSNFNSDAKKTVVFKEKNLMKRDFTLVVSVLTMNEKYVEITYVYERNRETLLKSVAVGNMNEEEKIFFVQMLKDSLNKTKKVITGEEIKEEEQGNSCRFDEYINAISNELFFLKNNGGKKHKVTDGRLLTPNSNEYCYSFELESELYLADDAPVAVIRGLEIVHGTVIVCDGFQIIISLEQKIGDTVPSAQISVEPWKLLEKLKDKIKTINKNDYIARKLFYEGPGLADKNADNISSIKKGQEVAISHAQNEDITIIWGPPGTGKTYTMAQMTKQFVSAGKSVLIVSHSNISVDNVVKQIAKQFSECELKDFLSRGKVLRYGFVRDEELSKNDSCVAFNFALNSHEELKQQYLASSEESRKLKIELEYKNDTEKAAKRKEIEKRLKILRATLKTETQILTDKAQVVATTVSKLYMDKLFENKKYDVVMFDEASMAYVPQLLCAATFARQKFICVGDFRQLAPIVQSEKAKAILEKDIFNFLNICRHNIIYNHQWLVMLNEQRRMHPDISKFSSQRIYKGLLKDHASVASKWNDVVEREPLPNHAMNLIDLAGAFCAASKNADNSRFNILSALLSFAIALQSEHAQEKNDFKNEEKVGIITPYAAQTRLIRAMIQDYRQKEKTAISCATVHQFQGSERNVVVFDAVESYPFVKPGWLVAKNDNGSVLRLINVALTRARCKFITLANTKFWHSKFQDTNNTYFSLLEHIVKNDNVVKIKEDGAAEFLQKLNLGENINLIFEEEAAFDMLIKDIKSAKKQIVIMLPTDKLNMKYEMIIYNVLKEQSQLGVTIIGSAKKVDALNDTWKELLSESKNASFPLISIDGTVTWYGFPLTELYFEENNSKLKTVINPIFRIRGKHTNEMINSLCDLEYKIDESGTRSRLLEKVKTTSDKGLIKFISEKEKCKKCKEPMTLVRSHNCKYMLRCSKCNATDFLSVYTMNEYLNKVNAKCSVCGMNIYAGVGQRGIYVKCNNGHFTDVSDLS